MRQLLRSVGVFAPGVLVALAGVVGAGDCSAQGVAAERSEVDRKWRLHFSRAVVY